MTLVRLIYVSTPTRNASDFACCADDFTTNNARNSITGILVYDTDFFLQWLEGPRANINKLYQVLLQDDRHKDLEIVHFQEIHVRQFPRWNMRCVVSTDINESILLRFMYESGFDPYRLSGAACVEFLKEVGRITETP